MRKVVFVTQKIDPDDPVLAATVPMARALAERVDELAVLCDSAVAGALPANARVHEFGAPTQLQRGLRFGAALARELRPRPQAVIAHMVPLYAVLAAPLVRPLDIELVLWYTHWKAHPTLRAAERVSTSVVSVDRSSFPFASAKLRTIGHGIDVRQFPCADGAQPDGPLRALVLGRYSPSKGLAEIVRGFRFALDRGLDTRLELHGSASPGMEEAHKNELEHLIGGETRIEVGGPVPHSEIAALLARSDVLVNNHRAADKVVYEAAAACVPVLASGDAFRELLPPDLRFDSAESLADRLVGLDRRRRPELREAVERNHSVDSWAEGILSGGR